MIDEAMNLLVVDGPEMVYRMIIEDAGMQRVPVVLISGIVGLTQVAGRVGTPYFMGKPFDLDKLLRMLQRAVRRSGRRCPCGGLSQNF